MSTELVKANEDKALQTELDHRLSFMTNQVVGVTSELMRVTERGPARFIIALGTILLTFAMLMKIFGHSLNAYLTPTEFIAAITVAALILGIGAYFQGKTKDEIAGTGQKVIEAHMGLINSPKNQKEEQRVESKQSA